MIAGDPTCVNMIACQMTVTIVRHLTRQLCGSGGRRLGLFCSRLFDAGIIRRAGEEEPRREDHGHNHQGLCPRTPEICRFSPIAWQARRRITPEQRCHPSCQVSPPARMLLAQSEKSPPHERLGRARFAPVGGTTGDLCSPTRRTQPPSWSRRNWKIA
jgi:hypothetical protein